MALYSFLLDVLWIGGSYFMSEKMSFAFVSNFMNHHQLSFCKEMVDLLGEEQFSFIAMTPFNADKKTVGYQDMNEGYPWIIRAYESRKEMMRARHVVQVAKYAIINPAYIQFSKLRTDSKKITFLTSERILKRGTWMRLVPPKIVRTWRRYLQFKNDNFFVLCSSAYTTYDLSLFDFPVEKCFKWGYFPDAKIEPVSRVGSLRLLWVGRMIGWKRPEDLQKASATARRQGLVFKLTFVGDGPKRKDLEEAICRENMRSFTCVTGGLSNNQVRCMMAESDIFIATSDYNEGWGAVINEAMSAGCAVIATRAMGAAPYLIENGENGLLYDFGNIDQLASLLEVVIHDETLRVKLQRNGKKTIEETWNARVAAERVIDLAEHLSSDGTSSPFESGPCSKAPVLPPKHNNSLISKKM